MIQLNEIDTWDLMYLSDVPFKCLTLFLLLKDEFMQKWIFQNAC